MCFRHFQFCVVQIQIRSQEKKTLFCQQKRGKEENKEGGKKRGGKEKRKEGKKEGRKERKEAKMNVNVLLGTSNFV